MPSSRSLINSLRQANGSLDREAIQAILPYGAEFLFVDSISRLEEREVEATFQIPRQANYLQGHFEGLPIMPGALLSEAVAQAGSLAIRYHLDCPPGVDILGHHVESARFLSLALPGDLLHFSVHLKSVNHRSARLEGRVRVGDRKVGRMRMVVAIVKREDLKRMIAKLDTAGTLPD